MPQCNPIKQGVGLQPPDPWAAPPAKAWAAGHLLSSILQVPHLAWHLLQLSSRILQGPQVIWKQTPKLCSRQCQLLQAPSMVPSQTQVALRLQTPPDTAARPQAQPAPECHRGQ